MIYNRVVIEPTWCLFCEDRPADGKMILVYEHTQNLVTLCKNPTPLPTCTRCGVRHTGATAASRTNNGKDEAAVFQYEHPNYPDVAHRVAQLATQLTCSVCGNPEPASEVAMTKFLRMWPHIVSDPGKYLKLVCGSCDEKGLCPCCGEKDCEGENHGAVRP